MQLRFNSLFSLCAAILSTTAAIGCSAEVGGESVSADEQALSKAPPVVIPDALAVPAGNKLAFKLSAEGVQMYTCTVSATNVYAWTFVAPDANLYDHHCLAGAHYAGPTWESLDGSTVVGAKVAGVTVDPTAVSWLLLKATANTGSGRMSKITYVQRLSTTGGNAPATGCDADHVGAKANVDYTANYYFYEVAPVCGH